MLGILKKTVFFLKIPEKNSQSLFMGGGLDFKGVLSDK